MNFKKYLIFQGAILDIKLFYISFTSKFNLLFFDINIALDNVLMESMSKCSFEIMC